jgi:hypothetical protein
MRHIGQKPVRPLARIREQISQRGFFARDNLIGEESPEDAASLEATYIEIL